jgi:hypothetical protein
MPDVNYAAVGGCDFETASAVNPNVFFVTYNTGSVLINLAGRSNSNFYSDSDLISVAIFR